MSFSLPGAPGVSVHVDGLPDGRVARAEVQNGTAYVTIDATGLSAVEVSLSLKAAFEALGVDADPFSNGYRTAASGKWYLASQRLGRR